MKHLPNVAGAAALGILLGLLMGLSAAPVVGAVIAAVLTLAGAVLGLRGSGEPTDQTFALNLLSSAGRLTENDLRTLAKLEDRTPDGDKVIKQFPHRKASQMPVAAFAIGCSLACLVGIWLRTHGALESQVEEQTTAAGQLEAVDEGKIQLLADRLDLIDDLADNSPDGGVPVRAELVQERRAILMHAQFDDWSGYQFNSDNERNLERSTSATEPNQTGRGFLWSTHSSACDNIGPRSFESVKELADELAGRNILEANSQIADAEEALVVALRPEHINLIRDLVVAMLCSSE